jgi:hypothetical protein
MRVRLLRLAVSIVLIAGCSDYREFWEGTEPDCTTTYRPDQWSPTGVTAETRCPTESRAAYGREAGGPEAAWRE